AYFDQHKEDLGQREAVRLRGILVATEQEARAVRQEIVGGKDFAQVAKERSLDPLTRDAGGDMGMVERGQLAPELESVAFSLPPGQVSDPVKTAEGWRVLRVEEHRPATAAVFENVKDRIRVILLDQAVQERGPAWLEQLRQKAKITNRLDNG
ncbi:MAG: peptidylprolyl isomerase, partial [Clostridia bacterium]|nr:peptidylprolyl isomerase [Clostridia bacterium]